MTNKNFDIILLMKDADSIMFDNSNNFDDSKIKSENLDL